MAEENQDFGSISQDDIDALLSGMPGKGKSSSDGKEPDGKKGAGTSAITDDDSEKIEIEQQVEAYFGDPKRLIGISINEIEKQYNAGVCSDLGSFDFGISYYIFNEGIKYVSATESMIFATLEAVFNPIWVFAGIGEVPSPGAIIGGAVIIFAILFHSFYLSPKFDNATNQKTADIPDRQKQLPL